MSKAEQNRVREALSSLEKAVSFSIFSLTEAALLFAALLVLANKSHAQSLSPAVGNNFTNAQQIGSLGGTITQMAFDPNDPSHLYVTSWFGGVQRFDYSETGNISNPEQVVPDSVVNVNGTNGSIGIAFHDDPVLGSVMYLSPAKDNTGGTQQGLGTIVRLTDTNGDGTWGNHASDVNQTIVEDIYSSRWTHQINQMSIHNNTLYVSIGSMTNDGGASGAHPGEAAQTGAVSFIEDLTQLSSDTSTTNLAGFDIDIDDGQVLSAADVVAYKSDTQAFTSADPGKFRVFATGFRNAFGISTAPNGDVWVSNNQTQNPTPPDELHQATFQSDHGYHKENDVVGNWKDPGNTDPSVQAAQAAGYFQSADAPVALLGLNTAVTGMDIITAPGNDFDGHIVVTRAANNSGSQDVVLVDPADGSFVELITGGAGRPTDALIDPYGNLLILANNNPIIRVNVTGGLPAIVIGDLSGNGSIDVDDWNLLKPNFLLDTSGLTPLEALEAGDLDVSGRIDFADTHQFAQIFDAEHGPGSFTSLGLSVPEPTTLIQIVLMSGLALVRRPRARAFVPCHNRNDAPNPTIRRGFCSLTFLFLTSLILFGLAEDTQAQLLGGDTIGIDFATPSPVFGFTPNHLPAPGTNFNPFDTQTTDGATADFVGALIDLNGDPVSGVGFSVTNNAGKDSGLTGITGSGGPAPFTDATIYEDNYGAANVGNSGRADVGVLPEDANFVFTFSGLDDGLAYDISGGYLHASPNDNFNTTWEVDGQSATTVNTSGLPDAGYITLTGLSTNGSGDLAITVTKSVQLFVAGLSLTAVADDPEFPSLEVNKDTGAVTIISSSDDFDVKGYSITSPTDLLNPNGWASLQDTGFSGVNTDPNGNNTDPDDGLGWEELGDGTTMAVGEFNLQGSSLFGPSGAAMESLGALFSPQAADGDLVFELSLANGSSVFGTVNYVTGGGLAGDFNDDGVVDTIDYAVWRDSLDGAVSVLPPGSYPTDTNGTIDAEEYAAWKSNFGAALAGSTFEGGAVPEPVALMLGALAGLGLLAVKRPIR